MNALPHVSIKRSTAHSPLSNRRLAALSLAALGIVFGDIGTSPLYAFRESLGPEYGLSVDSLNVLGVLSLIFWSLVLVVSVKYLVFVMRADYDGEGGILALSTLVTPQNVQRGSGRYLLTLSGLFGTALLYGDGIITPAISVLSAVEGLEFAAPNLHPYVLPITVTILVLLFLFQRFGTARIGAVFGPVMLLWFTTLALLFFVLTNDRRGWSLPLALGVSGFFVLTDLAFLGASLFKIPDGGWFPLVVAALLFVLMTTWKRGRALVAQRLREGALPLGTFLDALKCEVPPRVPGTAVYLFRDPERVPPALLTNLRYNHVLHKRVVILVADNVHTPRVPEAKRERVTAHGEGFYQHRAEFRLYGGDGRAQGFRKYPWERPKV